MISIMNKNYIYTYLAISLIVSAYIHIGAQTILEFLGLTLVTLLFFVGIYFCLRNITRSKLSIKFLRGVGILVCAVLIYALFAYTGLSQFNTQACKPDLNGANIFTKEIKTYCNFIPWYAKAVK